jgi:hypothetical protein
MAASFLQRITHQFEQSMSAMLDRLDRLTDREQRLVVTGLSRSGKSTLFTALIAQLQAQADNPPSRRLPLLKSIPPARLDRVQLCTELPGLAPFPFAHNMAALAEGRWPASTQTLSGFRLTLWIKQANALKQKLIGSKRLSLFFYDYPGEWLMDLALLNQDYESWSNRTGILLHNQPQAQFSQAWLSALTAFDFNQPANLDNARELIDAYASYLAAAKAGGLSHLQPGAMLLPPTATANDDWAFCPLPPAILSDASHPWTRWMNARYHVFIEQWVRPFRDGFFVQADKQIILIDVLESLSGGRGYLEEAKHTLSSLSGAFVYGQKRWYQRFHRRQPISRVAFVATKLDLIPLQEQANLESLLHSLTQGIVHRLSEQAQVEWAHFMIASLVATAIVEGELVYQDPQGKNHRLLFEPIPPTIQQLADNEAYAPIQAAPPRLPSAHHWRSIYLDKLMDTILWEALK